MLCEQDERRTELLSFAMPRFAEVVWGLAEKRGYVRTIPYGAPLLFALALVRALSLSPQHKLSQTLTTLAPAITASTPHTHVCDSQGVVMRAYRREPRSLKPVYRTFIKHAFML